ncbi:MAG TPA: undecaprenyl-diphosphate phosphatase [Streptosporangiaceae bacterium]|nr:undecaprenyl-diphosphate phosphatase [Streptosporangiaceae bacterium]
MVPHLTYPEALVVGLIQGVTELFPISSLGHSVLIPALVGGSWAQDLNVSKPQSPYLAFIVGMHVATAIAMIVYFWRDWLRIIGGFFTSIARRRIETVDQKLAWLIVLATIPIGIVGALLQHQVQDTFAKPVVTAVFLAINGLVLFGGERLRRRELAAGAAGPDGVTGVAGVTGPDGVTGVAGVTGPAGGRGRGPAGPGGNWDPALAPGGRPMYRDDDPPGMARPAPTRPGGTLPMATEDTWVAGSRAGSRAQVGGRHSSGQRAARQQEVNEGIEADTRLTRVGYAQGVLVGALQIFALLPGISRDGIVMVGGMFRGLTRQDAARFSFLLSAPVIFAAGALKLPDLMGAEGNGIRGQILAGSILSGIGAFLALRFLVRYLQDQSRTLMPFAIYCLVAGVGSAIYLSIH